MSKIAKHLILFLATLLLAFIVSGTHGSLFVYFGYFCFGYALPAFLLKGRHETAAVSLWAVLIILFAYVFEADRMLGLAYRPSADGWAVLFSMPILGVVLRFVFMLIDRLGRPEAAAVPAVMGKAYNPREVHHAVPTSPDSRSGSMRSKISPGSPTTQRTGKAYRRLLGLWFCWPLGTLLLAFLDGDRWDRMRYDNSLWLGMFVPPLLMTLGYIAYRIYRDRKRAQMTALMAVLMANDEVAAGPMPAGHVPAGHAPAEDVPAGHVPSGHADLQPHGTSAN